MTSLILGCGYIGAALAARLAGTGERVVALDNGFATDLTTLRALSDQPRAPFELIQADIRDAAALQHAFERAAPVRTVYLLAAQASAHPDAAPAEYTEETNLRAPRLVCDAALAHGAPAVVYGSSFHVYGAGPAGAVDESRPYGALRDLAHLSKVYAEKLGELYARERGLPFSPVRLGIVYGPGPVLKRDLRFVTVPHAFCLRLLRGEAPRMDPSGAHPQGFVHLDDAVEALISARVDQGYAPANAVTEVLTVPEVLERITEAARRRGLHVPPPSTVKPSVTERFSVTSRLDGTWTPRRLMRPTAVPLLEALAAMETAA